MFRGSAAMEMERMGQAGSIVLLFGPFRDRADIVGYPLNDFAVECLSVADHPGCFGDCGWKEWIEDNVAVPLCYSD